MKKTLHHWQRNYFTILIGQTVSLIGSSAVQFALIWWLAKDSDSAIVLSLVGLAAFLPQTILGPFVGVWLDRWDRKKIVILSDLFTGVMALILSIWFYLGKPSYLGIIVVILIRALMSVFHTPSIQAIVPSLVPEKELVRANSWSQFLQSGAFMLGPVIGAAMFASFPLWLILLTDFLGAIVAAITLGIVPVTNNATETCSNQYFKELKEGFYVFLENKSLLLVISFGFFSMSFFLPLSSLFPLMISNHFELSAWFASIVQFSYAAGMMIGALLIGQKNYWKDKLWVSQLANILLGITVLVSGMTRSDSSGFWIFVGMCFLMGGFSNLLNILLTAYLQENVITEKLGRAFSLFNSGMSGAMPLGLIIAAPAAEIYGVAFWLVVCGSAICCLSMLSLLAYHFMFLKKPS